MSCGSLRMFRNSLTAGLAILLMFSAVSLWAQHGSDGKISITVVDPTGSVVQGAALELVDLSTNEVRKAETQAAGTRTFLNLPLGKYKLTVSKGGFQTKVFTDVVVQAAQTTDIPVELVVGAVTEVVQVNTNEAPLVETSSSSIGTTIDLKQIENLPLQGRDLSVMSTLSPGFTGSLYNGGGTWNGLPSIAQGNNIDGVISSTSRMKFQGNGSPGLQARVEDIAEMTVQTDQLDLNQGYGQANMQVNFVTRRGTSAYHGRIFEDFRNTSLNANSWLNDAQTSLDPSNPVPKNKLILNEFGGSVGGPILKDKLFFFGSFSMSKQPGGYTARQWVFVPTAQQGNFTYTDTNGNTQTVNVLQAAGKAGFPSAVNSQTSSTLQAVNGVLNLGALTPVPGDSNVQQLSWQVSSPRTLYFPTVRVDYIPTQSTRLYVAFNETKETDTGINAPNLPGAAFAGTGASNKFINYTAALGFDWTLSSTLVNAFRGGFLYNFSSFGFDGKVPSSSQAQIAWNLPNLQAFPGAGNPSTSGMNGSNFQIPTGSYYPLFNASDTLTWQHSAHTLSLGVSWWREQNHYYNGVLGFPVVQLGNNTGTGPGLSNGDPAQGAFNNTTVPNAPPVAQQEAESLYAILTGRINSINGQFPYDPKTNQYVHSLGAYNLDELTKAWGVFVQDSYRIKPSFTLNYGLRWDFTWADRDLTNLYHSADPANIFGPSGTWNTFNPGSLKGPASPVLTQNSQPYNNWFVAPQPAIGFAWNPHGNLLGGDKTVIRGGFSFRKFTEPQQYVWNQASDYGSFYYQGFFLNPNNTGQAGTFSPGSLMLGSQFPAYGFSPQSFQKVANQSDFTFLGGSVPGVNGIDPHLQQPYTESWNLGVQRQLNDSTALEIRYIGNRTLRQWMAIDPNEINIFENGFLGQFKAAQKNLALNNASGNPNLQGSFANNGLPGQQPLPIFQAAFAGEAMGADGNFADYTNTGFVGQLNTGQAGLLANTLAGIGGPVPYICNLVGSSFSPCATNAGFTGAGAGYPINFFQANPFSQGAGFISSELVAEGYSNYNGLQVDLRERPWHGLQFDANYTWSHTLGISTPNNWQGQVNEFSLRTPRLSYGPTIFDVRHAVNFNGTFDLPFGRGKAVLGNTNGVVDKLVGGWNVGTILTFQTGTPFLLQGGNNTFNANPNNDGFGDSGVVLTGVTPAQLQSSVGVYHLPGTTNVAFINPKYLASPTGGGANPQFINPNTTPGTIGQLVYLHGPHFFNDDIAISKTIPIRESLRFFFQAEMLNAFNHPNFQPGTTNGCTYFCYTNGFTGNVQQGQFGIGGISPNYPQFSPNQGARVIELRANIEF